MDEEIASATIACFCHYRLLLSQKYEYYVISKRKSIEIGGVERWKFIAYFTKNVKDE